VEERVEGIHVWENGVRREEGEKRGRGEECSTGEGRQGKGNCSQPTITSSHQLMITEKYNV